MYNPLLLLDFYKVTHSSQYPHGLTRIVSYYTPRMSRLEDVDKLTLFGLQGFIKTYLIEGFNRYFFKRDKAEVVAEYNRVLTATLGPGSYDAKKIEDLHDLGYLPLAIRAVPEGMRTKIGVPQIEIANTHPNFPWLVNTIETLLSCSMWHTQVSAEVGYRYRAIVDMYVNLTCDDSVDARRLLGDFSMRGQQSCESAIKSSAGWLLSFYNTATVPAIMWLEDNYNCDCTKEPVGFGAISTEHSVMCSNFAVDGDEITHIKRLLTEIYPNHSFSMVSDSYDYWRLVTELLPQCKDEILAHNGTLSIRGDSGDPVEILAGKNIYHLDPVEYDDEMFVDKDYTIDWLKGWACDNGIENSGTYYFHMCGKYFAVAVNVHWSSERGVWTDRDYDVIYGYTFGWEEIQPNAELLGTVWALDQIIGHTINSKGYKVLNPKLKAIYGDSITPQRCEEIYRRLEAQGYAINNVSLGVGSFSMMCLEAYDDNGVKYNPYTRDTFGIAVKATYAEDENGNPINIFKQPKALAWKKSQKGCCIVALDGMSYTDEHTYLETIIPGHNLLQPIFVDGEMIHEYTLDEVRKNLYPEV